MKKLLLLLLVLTGLAAAQTSESHAYVTTTLTTATTADTDTMFFLRQENGYTYASTTLPTKSLIYGSKWSTPISMRWELTQVDSAETDSLYLYVMPLTYDMSAGVYEIVSNVFYSVSQKANANAPHLKKKSTRLSWTSTVPYYVSLLDSLGVNYFEGAAGICVMAVQKDSVETNCTLTVQPSFRP